LLLDKLGLDKPADETTLLAAENSSPCRRGIIGKRALTLNPMIPAGSIVQIDTLKRTISSRKDWTHEFQRSIYFLTTQDAYVCGWCELDKDSDWLTAHTPPPVSSSQPAMEISKRNRNDRLCHACGHSTDSASFLTVAV
jgi:hypothetical protein